MIEYTIKLHSEKMLNPGDVIKKDAGRLAFFYIDVVVGEPEKKVGFVNLPPPPRDYEIEGADIIGKK